MDAITRPVRALTAADVMSRSLVTVPRQMSLRDAARLLRRARVGWAAVIDEQGSCVGMLSAADYLGWVEEGCPEAVIDPDRTCPYQVKGHLLTGAEAVICTLADGSCPLQVVQPATGGRHTMVCTRQATEGSPFGTVPRYTTTDGVTVRSQTPLPELMRRMIDSRIDRLVVVNAREHPVGIVSATDILAAFQG